MRIQILTALTLTFVWAAAVQAQESPDLYIGGMAHGRENIEILAELGLGNFIWIPPTYYWESGNIPWDATHTLMDDVDACLDHDFSFMISQRRGLGDKVRHGGFEYGGHGSGETHSATEIRSVIARAGDRFLGLHQEEMDADFVQAAWRPTYRARNPQFFDFTDRAGGLQSFESELRRITDRYHQWGAQSWPNLCVTYHHSGFRTGADLVMAEFLEHLPTTELQLACLRGGARQFSGQWGMWVSPWWWGAIPCEDPGYWGTPRAEKNGGHSVESFRRALWLSYASGAKVLTAQETEPLFGRDIDGNYALTAWGRELKRIWDYARQHPDPREPLIATAVLVDPDWGWAPAHLWQDWIQEEMIWGKLSAARSDAMFPRYLDMLLPGFGRTRESVMARKDIFPGYFAATPHGPFDIVTADINAAALSAYRNVLVLGDVSMTPDRLMTLKAFVKQGGYLFINAFQMRNREAFVQDPEFLGLTFKVGEIYSKIDASNRIRVTGDIPGASPEYEEGYFCVVEVEPSTAETLADDGQGHPVLLSNEFGKGRVYVSTPEYMLTGFGDRRTRLEFFAENLPRLFQDPLIRVNSVPTLSWTACRQGDGILLVVANHCNSDVVANIVAEENWRPMDAKSVGQVIAADDVLLIRFSNRQ